MWLLRAGLCLLVVFALGVLLQSRTQPETKNGQLFGEAKPSTEQSGTGSIKLEGEVEFTSADGIEVQTSEGLEINLETGDFVLGDP